MENETEAGFIWGLQGLNEAAEQLDETAGTFYDKHKC